MNDSNPAYNVFRSPKRTKTTLDELYKFLKKFALSDSLYVIAMLNAALKHGHLEVNDEEDVPKEYVHFINQNCKTTRDRLSLYHALVRLPHYLILSGANDYKTTRMELYSKELADAVNMTNELYDKDVENSLPAGTSLFARLLQPQLSMTTLGKIFLPRSILLFLELPKKVSIDYDFDAKMIEYFGMNCFQFIVSGFALWIKSNGVLERDLLIDIEGLSEKIPPEVLEKFITLSSGTYQDYRTLIRGGDGTRIDKLQEIYGLDPLIRMPAVRVQKSSKLAAGSYIIPHPFHFIQRASTGIFYLLADQEQKIANKVGLGGRNPFRVAFGTLYQAYVGMQLSQIGGNAQLIDLDQDYTQQVPRPDFALIEDDVCVLFEVKASLLRIEAKTLFKTETLRKELSDSNVKKGVEKQLMPFEKMVLEKRTGDVRFDKINKVVTVLVGYEDIFAANAVMLPILEELYPMSQSLQVATVSDIEVIGEYLSAGLNVCSALFEKLEIKRNWSVQGYLDEKFESHRGENKLLKSTFDKFVDDLIKEDSEYLKTKLDTTG